MASTRKKDMMRDELLHRLLTGRYRYGQRILVKEIGEETGVSRQPIMTALNALSSEGFVNVVAQVGCEVISPSARDIADFYLMFERLEGMMSELAASRGSGSQLTKLVGINAQIRAIDRGDRSAQEQYRTLNRDFHGLIHTMAATPLVQERQRNVFAMSDFFIAQSVGFMPRMTESVDEHDEIIRALRAGDSEAARSAMQRHIAAVGKEVLGQAQEAIGREGTSAPL